MTGAAERRDWIVAVVIVAALTALRLAVVAFTLRPGARKAAERAAEIPLKED